MLSHQPPVRPLQMPGGFSARYEQLLLEKTLRTMFKDGGRAADIYGRAVRNAAIGIPTCS